jgi:hypothetical protein
MTIDRFIKQNSKIIDTHISQKLHKQKTKNSYQERRLWVLNDYELYRWALNNGVEVY